MCSLLIQNAGADRFWLCVLKYLFWSILKTTLDRCQMCPIRLRCLFVSVNITELLNASLQTENKTTFPVKRLFQANLSDNTVPGIMSENFNICCIIFPFHWLSILWEETCKKKKYHTVSSVLSVHRMEKKIFDPDTNPFSYDGEDTSSGIH